MPCFWPCVSCPQIIVSKLIYFNLLFIDKRKIKRVPQMLTKNNYNKKPTQINEPVYLIAYNNTATLQCYYVIPNIP